MGRRVTGSSRAWHAYAVCVALLSSSLAACSVQRSPELGDARPRSLGEIVLPGRTANDTPAGNGQVTSGLNDMTPQVGGMQCGGVFCPFVSAPAMQCCTDTTDVTNGAARAADKCGVTYAAASDPVFGDDCWQRDQQGVPDPACPSIEGGGAVIEPGCCTEQGSCGTLNTATGIGCHYESGVEPEPCATDIVTETQCDPLGVFAVRTLVDVAWGGRSGGLVGLTDDGRDTIVIELRVEVQGIDDRLGVQAVAQPCNVELPPFYSTTLCESYKPIFPISIWESPTLPLIPLTGQYQCLNPGCILTLNATTSLIGIELNNPEAPWPLPSQTYSVGCPSGSGVDCFSDHDFDGLPGLTIEILKSGNASGPSVPAGTACNGLYTQDGAPLSANAGAIVDFARRADRLQLGTRTKLGGAAKIAQDCSGGVGAGIADFIQSRAWGCVAQEGTFDFGEAPAGPNDPCTAAQAAFMDENLPIYYVLRPGEMPADVLKVNDKSASLGPQFSMVRLGNVGDPITCTDVREAAHPQQP